MPEFCLCARRRYGLKLGCHEWTRGTRTCGHSLNDSWMYWWRVSGSMSAKFLATNLQGKNSTSGERRNQFVGFITFE